MIAGILKFERYFGLSICLKFGAKMLCKLLNISAMLFFVINFFTFSSLAVSPECIASYIHTTDARTPAETVPLEIESQSGAHLQLSKDFHGRSFFALYFRDTEELLMQIVQSNDTTRGQVARGRFDSNNSMSLTEVLGATVYRL